ncbi:MAG: methyltransferase type 11 [Stappia sp.]|uniref:class I SAM-dependent methyltransferase n=1 Tax=Stappia sp. TaxID=1870903 RepID=UPI000C62A0C1|nr:class I SAM-dependent methyltransferase [Stappia sp.]MAB00663.1 methyltransferase type 11 [Stappia sp.]MBM18733.1 methyltransferase type 11 [Stappia sp.]
MSGGLFSHVLRAVERGAFPRTRKWAWRGLYNMLSRVWRDDDWRFMNYGYVAEGEAFALDPDEEPERPFIGLYHQAVNGLDLEGRDVLEVGSGRGGGARYIARTFSPRSVTGLDYSPGTVRRARALCADTPDLAFKVGDAEALPFADASFDVVVNIESSHCYANVAGFAEEVARVLRPGGIFTFADMRGRSMLEALDRDLSIPGLELLQERDLTEGVLAALDAAEARKQARIARNRLSRRFMKEFAGTRGSLLYKGLQSGSVVYLARRYRKGG